MSTQLHTDPYIYTHYSVHNLINAPLRCLQSNDALPLAIGYYEIVSTLGPHRNTDLLEYIYKSNTKKTLCTKISLHHFCYSFAFIRFAQPMPLNSISTKLHLTNALGV